MTQETPREKEHVEILISYVNKSPDFVIAQIEHARDILENPEVYPIPVRTGSLLAVGGGSTDKYHEWLNSPDGDSYLTEFNGKDIKLRSKQR